MDAKRKEELAGMGDTIFLELAFRYLAARAGRIGADHALTDLLKPGVERSRATCKGSGLEDAKALVFDLTAAEKHAREAMTVHAEACRKDKKTRLGLDAVADRHGLDDNERLVLLVCAASGIGQRMSEDLLAGLGQGYFGGTMSVENAITLIDPRSLDDRLRARRYFHPEAPLIKGGLVLIEFRAAYRIPSDLLEASLHISNKALCEITGAGYLTNERWATK